MKRHIVEQSARVDSRRGGRQSSSEAGTRRQACRDLMHARRAADPQLLCCSYGPLRWRRSWLAHRMTEAAARPRLMICMRTHQ